MASVEGTVLGAPEIGREEQDAGGLDGQPALPPSEYSDRGEAQEGSVDLLPGKATVAGETSAVEAPDIPLSSNVLDEETNRHLSATEDEGAPPSSAEAVGEEDHGAGVLNGLEKALGDNTEGRGHSNRVDGFEPAEAPAGAASEPVFQSESAVDARAPSEGKSILGVPRGVLGMGPPSVDAAADGAQMKEKVERQFCLVRVPRPDLSDIVSEIRQAEIKEQEKRKNVQFINAAISLKKSARGEAVKARQEHRAKSVAISSEIHNKHTQMQPMRDRMKEIRDAGSEARSAGDRFSFKTVAGLNQRLADIEYRIQHESIPLQEEKQLLREMQLLEKSRKDVEALEAKSTSVTALNTNREGLQSQLAPLRAEVTALKQQGDAERNIANQFHSEVEGFDKEIAALVVQREAASKEQDAAYQRLQALRRQAQEKEDGYWQFRRDLQEFHRLAATKDFAALEVFSTAQVEGFHAKWADPQFRSNYVKANEQSTIRRFQSLDTRRLGVDEDPAELISGASHDPKGGNKSALSAAAAVSSSAVSAVSSGSSGMASLAPALPLANGDSKAAKVPKPDSKTGSAAAKSEKKKPAESDVSAKGIESESAEDVPDADSSAASQKKKGDRGPLLNGIASAAAAAVGVAKEGKGAAAAAAAAATDPDADARKVEAAKKKAEEDEAAAAVEAKKKARNEAIAKAKEAEERKRKAAERAAQKAELKAAKDAEEAAKKREKEKLRRERKKAAAASSAAEGDDSSAAQSAAESGGEEGGQLASEHSLSAPSRDLSKGEGDEAGLSSRQRKRNSSKTRKTGGGESDVATKSKFLPKKGRGGRSQQGTLFGFPYWLLALVLLLVVGGFLVFLYFVSLPEPSTS